MHTTEGMSDTALEIVWELATRNAKGAAPLVREIDRLLNLPKTKLEEETAELRAEVLGLFREQKRKLLIQEVEIGDF
jgi:hypothetical protein